MKDDYVGSLSDTARDALDDPVAFVGQFLTDDLLRHGGILAGATVLSGGLNYAFQVYMGRALGPEQYGVFGALFALFYLVSVLSSGIQFSATKFTAELAGRGEGLATFHRGLYVRTLLFGCGIFALLALVSPYVEWFLALSSPWPVVLVAASIPFSFTFKTNMGSFQGLQRFELLGSYHVLDAGVKLGAGVVLVSLGYGVYGAFGAIALAAAIALLVTTLHVRKHLPQTSRDPAVDRVDYGSVYEFAPSAVLAGFCLTVPASVDVILVKHLFTGYQSGLYTAASVLGKVLVFFPMGISEALFPKATTDSSGGEIAKMQGLLYRALFYTAVVAGTGAIVFWTVPEFVLSIFFGDPYLAAAPLVRWYGVAVFGFVLVVVLIKFELARGGTRFVHVVAGMTVVEVGLMMAFGGSMIRIIQVVFVVNASLLSYGLLRLKV